MEQTRPASRLAPLKPTLPLEKRAFAEDLRQIFLSLDISVRRYAARHHMDGSTLTRYLNGDRLPPWDIVARLIADAREDDIPVTFEAEDTLRKLHRAAVATNRRDGEKQALQEQLAEADDETRRIKTRERALEEALLDRQRRMAETQGRCRALETELDAQRLRHSCEIDVWQDQYRQLESEYEDLREQVVYLHEALTVTRAELIAAEEQCLRLETRLAAVQNLAPEEPRALPLMAALEETDRSASVSELVLVVSSLESRAQRAIATEVVTSVARSRAVQEVAGLLSALEAAGLSEYAEAVLPALVMMRPVVDTADLALHLNQEGVADPVIVLLRASVELHTPADIAAFAEALVDRELTDYAVGLLSASCVTRPPADVAAILSWLDNWRMHPVIAAVLDDVGRERPVADLLVLGPVLRQAGMTRHVEALHTAVAGSRGAADVAEYVDALTRYNRLPEAEEVFATTRHRPMDHVVALVAALRATMPEAASAMVEHSMRSRPQADTITLIGVLYCDWRHRDAAELLITALRLTHPSHVPALLDGLGTFGVVPGALLLSAAGIGSPEDTAAMAVVLQAGGLAHLAELVIDHVLRERLTGHVALFLHAVRAGGLPQGEPQALRERAAGATASVLAGLALGLAAAGMPAELNAILGDVAVDTRRRMAPDVLPEGGGPDQILGLLRVLSSSGPSGSGHRQTLRITRQLWHHVIISLGYEEQARLVIALESAGLGAEARELTGAAQDSRRGRRFTEALDKERIKGVPKVLSLAFWRKEPTQDR